MNKTHLDGRSAEGEERGAAAADAHLEAVYSELRRVAHWLMAQERSGQTLDPTALVHEAYVRLVETGDGAWNDRRHFFNAASLAMRRILIDRARAKGALKRGGGQKREMLGEIAVPVGAHFDLSRAEELDAALEELRGHNERWAEAIQLRLLLGLGVAQSAEVLGCSTATVKNDCRFALAWLKVRMRDEEA